MDTGHAIGDLRPLVNQRGGRVQLPDVLYSLGWYTIRPLLGVAGLFSTKLAEAVRGRESAAADLCAWADGADAAGPVLWLHGASAGELAGAAPLVADLRRRLPALRLVVTYSSPSGRPAAERLEPAYHGFIPLDLRRHTDRAMNAVQPAALVYAKYDVWPNLTSSARAAAVPVVLVNATVRSESRRLRHPGRAVLAGAYRSLSAVGAVSEEDRSRLEALGARREVITVTGDAAIDQALARLGRARGRPLRLPARAPGVVRLIGGSTWAEDDAVLVEAVADLHSVELVLVPHEPSPDTVGRIRARIELRMRTSPRLFSELDSSSVPAAQPGVAPPPLIVDTVGMLAELYGEGDLAYVGGGLAGKGLHSVVEPAAAGLPVLFGARHDRWEADGLLRAGAAREVEATTLYATVVSLLDPERRRRMGRAAKAWVQSHAGSGRAGADLVASLLSV